MKHEGLYASLMSISSRPSRYMESTDGKLPAGDSWNCLSIHIDIPDQFTRVQPYPLPQSETHSYLLACRVVFVSDLLVATFARRGTGLQEYASVTPGVQGKHLAK